MNCATCTHIDLDRKDMSRHQFGHCAFDEKHVYKGLSYERNCNLYAPAEEHIAAARLTWLANPKSILQEDV